MPLPLATRTHHPPPLPAPGHLTPPTPPPPTAPLPGSGPSGARNRRRPAGYRHPAGAAARQGSGRSLAQRPAMLRSLIAPSGPPVTLTPASPHTPCHPLLLAVNYDDLHSFDPATKTWTRLSATDAGRPSVRSKHGFTSTGGRLYVHGGSSFWSSGEAGAKAGAGAGARGWGVGLMGVGIR